MRAIYMIKVKHFNYNKDVQGLLKSEWKYYPFLNGKISLIMNIGCVFCFIYIYIMSNNFKEDDACFW